MIRELEPLSIAESLDYVEKSETENPELKAFMSQFVSIKPSKARELREKLESLNIIKMNKSHVAKIIDTLPENSQELNKIFVDVSLDENESNNILNAIKGNK